MIPQLLQITTTPIKYELHIERAKLVYDQDLVPKVNVTKEPSKLTTKSQNAQVQTDTYQARASLGYVNSTDFYKQGAAKGKESTAKWTRGFADKGHQLSRIDLGVTIAQVIEQKMLYDNQPVLYTAFLPSPGAEISWIPSQLDIDYHVGSLNFDWLEMRNVMNFVPGSVRMTILQYPRVDVEYVGGPIYIPPSADPDYVE